MLFLGKKSSHDWLMRSGTLNLVLMLWEDACIPLSIPLSLFPQWPVKTQHCNPESLPWPWISSLLLPWISSPISSLFVNLLLRLSLLSSLFFSALCDVRKKGGELCDRRAPPHPPVENLNFSVQVLASELNTFAQRRTPKTDPWILDQRFGSRRRCCYSSELCNVVEQISLECKRWDQELPSFHVLARPPVLLLMVLLLVVMVSLTPNTLHEEGKLACTATEKTAAAQGWQTQETKLLVFRLQTRFWWACYIGSRGSSDHSMASRVLFFLISCATIRPMHIGIYYIQRTRCTREATTCTTIDSETICC